MNFIPVSKPSIGEIELANVTAAVKSGWVSSLGDFIELFESQFADMHKKKFAISTSSGTTGLHLALEAFGIGPGDEVIVPDLTFVATANAVSHSGAKVVLVDIDPNTLCLDPEKLNQAITAKTKAIIPVHLYGFAADMNSINRIARENKLVVIEDAAEGLGAKYHDQSVGSIGDCGVFSFYGNKMITTGEGGMVITDNEDLARRMKHLRDHAMTKEKRYWHDEVGFNYRMTNIQAALGVAQLSQLSQFQQKRDHLAKIYENNLSELPGVRLNRKAQNITPSYWVSCFEYDQWSYDERDRCIDYLRKFNIDSRPYFYPLSLLPMYASDINHESKKISQRGLNLPLYTEMDDRTIEYVCSTISKYIRNYK